MLQDAKRSAGQIMAALAAALFAVVVLAAPAGAQAAGGSSSVGTADSPGGDGGSTSFVGTPVAVSGSSGASYASSTATNTGETGDATSIAVSNPVSASGVTGGAGDSGATESTPSATNTARQGSAVVVAASPVSNTRIQAASAPAVTGGAGVVPAQATTAGDAALSEAAALTSASSGLGEPPPFQPPVFEPVVPSGGVGQSLVTFSQQLVSEYSEAGTSNLLVLVLGILLAAKMARTFLRLNTYWVLRV